MTGVVAEGDGVDLEFAVGVGGGGLRPVRRFRFEHDRGALNGTMLRVVDDATNGAVDVGEDGDAGQEQGRNDEEGSFWIQQ